MQPLAPYSQAFVLQVDILPPPEDSSKEVANEAGSTHLHWTQVVAKKGQDERKALDNRLMFAGKENHDLKRTTSPLVASRPSPP